MQVFAVGKRLEVLVLVAVVMVLVLLGRLRPLYTGEEENAEIFSREENETHAPYGLGRGEECRLCDPRSELRKGRRVKLYTSGVKDREFSRNPCCQLRVIRVVASCVLPAFGDTLVHTGTPSGRCEHTDGYYSSGQVLQQ